MGQAFDIFRTIFAFLTETRALFYFPRHELTGRVVIVGAIWRQVQGHFGLRNTEIRNPKSSRCSCNFVFYHTDDVFCFSDSEYHTRSTVRIEHTTFIFSWIDFSLSFSSSTFHRRFNAAWLSSSRYFFGNKQFDNAFASTRRVSMKFKNLQLFYSIQSHIESHNTIINNTTPCDEWLENNNCHSPALKLRHRRPYEYEKKGNNHKKRGEKTEEEKWKELKR